MYWRTEGIPSFPVCSGGFLARSLTRITKCSLGVFAIVLGERFNSFSILMDTFLVEALLSGKRIFFIIFRSFFGFPIFSDIFSGKIFIFLSLIKSCTRFLAYLHSFSVTLNLDFSNFLSSLSRTAIFSPISPSNQAFAFFYTITVFAGVTLFIISTNFGIKSE